MVLLDHGVVHRHARVVDDLVHDAERVFLRHPAEVVDRARPAGRAGRVDFVDGDDLARLGFLEQVLVMEAPPGRGVAPEALAGVLRIGAGPRRDVENPHLEHVAGLGAVHGDRAGQDVHAQALAGAAAEQRGVHWAGAAPVDVLLGAVPVVHALRTRIALDHAGSIVVGVMGESLDRDEVARVDLHHRREGFAEVAPVHGLVRCGDVIVIPGAGARRRKPLRPGHRHVVARKPDERGRGRARDQRGSEKPPTIAQPAEVS